MNARTQLLSVVTDKALFLCDYQEEINLLYHFSKVYKRKITYIELFKSNFAEFKSKTIFLECLYLEDGGSRHGQVWSHLINSNLVKF